jgi:hypothetical protein
MFQRGTDSLTSANASDVSGPVGVDRQNLIMIFLTIRCVFVEMMTDNVRLIWGIIDP